MAIRRPWLAVAVSALALMAAIPQGARAGDADREIDALVAAVGTSKPMPVSRGELIKQLFPDIEAYTAGERRRWELTINHSDANLLELDITDPNLSIYYPIIDGKIVR